MTKFSEGEGRKTATAEDVADVIGDLKRRSEPYAGPRADLERDPAALAKALDTLRLQHEELLVAADELRAQLEELQRAETLIEEERARSQTIFTFAPDAYVVSDRNGIVLECNLAAMDLFGHDSQWLLGKPLSMVFVRVDAPALYEMTAAVRRNEKATARLQARRPASASNVATSAVVTKLGDEEKLFWRFRLLDTLELAPPATVPPPSGPEATRSVDESEPMRLLVVSKDDDAFDAFATASSLVAAVVERAESIEEALRVLQTFPATIVVADLWTDGHLKTDILTELRSRNHRPVPLCIALSGVGVTDSKYAINAGFHSFLVKPVSIRSAQTALQTLNRLLMKRTARRLRSKS